MVVVTVLVVVLQIIVRETALIKINTSLKAKIHYTILVADRFEAGRRPAPSWKLAYHLPG